MKNVLIIAYYFPPLGLSGVQRITKFAKYLPKYGWMPTILTVKDIYYYGNDPSLIEEVKNCHIIRTGSLDPLRLRWLFHRKKHIHSDLSISPQHFFQKLNRFVFPWIFIPDTKILWLPFVFFQSLRCIKNQPFHAVITTSPPHSSHFIGLILRRIFGIRWIADFRDSWLGETYDPVPSVIYKKINDWMKNLIIDQADDVTVVSEDIVRSLKTDSKQDRFHIIYNGFDPEDFRVGHKKGRNQKFTITYCGTLNHVLDPKFFFHGVNTFLSLHPETRSNIHIKLVGSIYNIHVQQSIIANQIQDIIQLTGYVTHQRSIQYLLQSDVLLLLLPAEAGKGVITGKLFEYMAAEKPVLAIIPEGEASEILHEYQTIPSVSPDDDSKIAETIDFMYDRWKTGDLYRHVNKKMNDTYNREFQSKYLAKLLQQ